MSGVGVLGRSLDKNKHATGLRNHTESLTQAYGSFDTPRSAYSVAAEVNICVQYVVHFNHFKGSKRASETITELLDILRKMMNHLSHDITLSSLNIQMIYLKSGRGSAVN